MKNLELNLAIVGDLAIGENITSQGSKISPGGAAYYSMVGAVNYSSNISVVGKVGSDFNMDILKKHDIDTQGVRQVSGKSCRFTAIQHEDNTRDFTAERGVAKTVDTSIFPEAYFSAKFIHLATQLPEHALIWLNYLHQHQAISVDAFETFVNLYPEETVQMLEMADMIFINLAEYKVLRMTEASYADKPVILKLGKDGVIYRSPTEELIIPAPKVTKVETSGAGDILAGAFLTLLSMGFNTEESLKRAVDLASKSVTQFGVEHLFT